MAKDFFKKIVLGVAISLTSVAVISGFTALSKRFQSDESTSSIEDSSVEFCAHIGSVQISGVAPTCTEPGLTEGIICGVCHGVVKPQEVIEPLGHTISIIPGVSATCAESGLSDGQYCERCESVVVEQRKLPFLKEHKETVDGFCIVCGKFDTTVMKEVAVTVGETVAGNWYRIYRGASLSAMGVNNVRFLAYLASTNYCNAFVDVSGPLGYIENFEVVITDEYIDIYFVEGSYTIKSYNDSVYAKDFTITADTTVQNFIEGQVYRLVLPTVSE